MSNKNKKLKKGEETLEVVLSKDDADILWHLVAKARNMCIHEFGVNSISQKLDTLMDKINFPDRGC